MGNRLAKRRRCFITRGEIRQRGLVPKQPFCLTSLLEKSILLKRARLAPQQVSSSLSCPARRTCPPGPASFSQTALGNRCRSCAPLCGQGRTPQRLPVTMDIGCLSAPCSSPPRAAASHNDVPGRICTRQLASCEVLNFLSLFFFNFSRVLLRLVMTPGVFP